MDNNNLYNQGGQNNQESQGDSGNSAGQGAQGNGQPVYQQPVYQQSTYQQSTYQQPYQPYQQPYQQSYQADSGLEEPVSFGEWMLTLLILCIPCVNIVMMFVWAFSSTAKKSKSNYFKAVLIWAVIWTVISIVMIAAIIGAAGGFAALMREMSYYRYYY